jgi:hypothetical protein
MLIVSSVMSSGHTLMVGSLGVTDEGCILIPGAMSSGRMTIGGRSTKLSEALAIIGVINCPELEAITIRLR